MIYFGFAMVFFGILIAVLGRDEAVGWGAVCTAIGVLFVVLALVDKQTQRVDELWKEYGTHVKHCQCMTREFDMERDGGGR